MFVTNLLKFFQFSGFFFWTSSQEIPVYVLAQLEDYNQALEQAAQQVLQQYSSDLSDPYDGRPMPFQMPDNFMHSYKPNTGVGNREDLIIDRVVELPLFDDESFSKWRYLRFGNLDYVLAMDKLKVAIWRKNINVSEPMVFPFHEAFFQYNAGNIGSISDAVMFVKRFRNRERLYVALLSANKASFISIYEIGSGRKSAAITFSLPFKTFLPDREPSSQLAILECKHRTSLVVLVANTNTEDIFYRESSGGGALDDYVEIHFPSAVDMVSFTINGYGYIAVANKTTCFVYKFDLFAQGHWIFERIYDAGNIVDLEHVRLGFSTYLFVSTLEYQMVYVWRKGGFFEQDIFFNSNVVQAVGIPLPNCRDDTILMFVKYGGDPVFYIWNGQEEKFVEVNLELQVEFLPLSNSITSFSFGSAAYVMFLNSFGYSKLVAIETHLRPVRDPILLVGKEVSNLMLEMQKMIDHQEATIQSMSTVIASAVRPNGNQRFTGAQIFSDLRSLNETIANVAVTSRTIAWEGSKISLEEYLAGTENLEAAIRKLELDVAEIERLLPDIVRVDEDAVLTGTKLFLGDVYGSSVITQSLNVQTAGGVHLPELQKQIYRMDKPKTIKGSLHFDKPVVVSGDLNIATTVNNVNLNADVMTSARSQVSNADLSFTNKVIVLNDLSFSGKLNGINIGKEVVTLAGDHVINGHKYFQAGILTINMSADFINTVDINYLFNQALTVSGDQLVTGYKHFTNSLYTHDIQLYGPINGYNFNALVDNIVRTDAPSIITGHKVFRDDVQVKGSAIVNGTINGLSIPNDLFLVDQINVVTGHKEFTGLVEATDIDVQGLINGINLPLDVITLSKDEILNGTFYFNDGLTVEQDLLVRGLVDGVDILALSQQALKLEELPYIQTAIFRGPVTVSGDLNVLGMINNVDLNQLYDNAVFKNERNIVIYSPKSFQKLVVDKVNLNGRLNSYMLDRDFMYADGDQVIYGKTEFKKSVVFQDITTENGIISGVNVSSLYRNRITLSIEEELNGDVEFVDHLIIDGDLTVRGSVGGLSFPSDFVLKSSHQSIANKIFEGNVNVGEMTVIGDVNAKMSFNNVDLREFWNDRITLSTDQEILGDIFLGNVSVDVLEIDGLVNGRDFEEFADNVMSLTKDQVVTGDKEFSGSTTILGSITIAQGVNGIKISDVHKRAFKLNANNVLTSPIEFQSPVQFRNLEVGGLINGINLNDLDRDSIKKDGVQSISGTVVFHEGFHVEGNIETDSVNGMNLAEDLLNLNTEQVITGTYTLKDVIINGNLSISGHINGIDLSNEAPLLARMDDVNAIHSDVIFKVPVTVYENIEVTGLVNGLDLPRLEKSVMRKSGDQNLVGHKVLKGTVTVFGDVDVSNVNGMNWKNFLEEVVRIDVPQAILGRKTFLSDLEVQGDIYVSGIAEIPNVNGVNLKQMKSDAVFIDEPANITGPKVFASTVEITGDLNVDLINGLHLKTDVVTLKCGDENPQVITGEKTFQNVVVYGNVYVTDDVNGYRLDRLAANTLSIHNDQIITGHKSFLRPVSFLRNVHPSTVNQMILRNELITLDAQQSINSNLAFENVRVNKDVYVSGLLNGIDVENLAQDALYVDMEQTVEGSYTIERAVIQSPVFVEGNVNGINLSSFRQNVSNFAALWNNDRKFLDNEMKGHCKTARQIYSAVERSYFTLDGFRSHQVIQSGADRIQVIPQVPVIWLTITRPSPEVFYYRLDEEMYKFELFGHEKTLAVEKKVYNFDGRTLAIHIGMETKNSYVSLDGENLLIPPGFFAGDALIRGKSSIVALLYNDTNSVEVYEISGKDTMVAKALGSTVLVEGATSVVLFEMSGSVYLAISCNLSPNFARDSSKIYSWMGNDWKFVQNVLAYGSSHVAHFVYQGYHYLAFSNSVPVFETKEPKAIQIYRNIPRGGVPFSLFQKLPFDDLSTMELFEFGSLPEMYMVVSNKTRIQVYLLDGEAGFKAHSTLYGKCITDAKPIVLGTELYLAVSQNDKVSKTVIYKGLTLGSVVSHQNMNLCS